LLGGPLSGLTLGTGIGMNKVPEVRRLMAGVVVDDLEAARAWYQTALGRPPDAAPMGGLLEWHLASDAWLQVVDIAKVREVQHTPQWGIGWFAWRRRQVVRPKSTSSVFTVPAVRPGAVW
jgi:hypothetical protein